MKITEIIKETDVEGKFGPQKRTAFKVEGNTNILSAFTKYSLKEGQDIDGEITQTEKDGKTYHNFKFAGNKNVGTNPELIRKLDTIITELAILKPMIKDIWNWKTSDGGKIPFEEDPLEGVF